MGLKKSQQFNIQQGKDDTYFLLTKAVYVTLWEQAIMMGKSFLIWNPLEWSRTRGSDAVIPGTGGQAHGFGRGREAHCYVYRRERYTPEDYISAKKYAWEAILTIYWIIQRQGPTTCTIHDNQ